MITEALVFRAWDAATDTVLDADLKTGETVTVAAGAPLSFGAIANSALDASIGSVRLTLTNLDTGETIQRLERVGPYTVFGDRPGEDIFGKALASGDYELTATAFVAANGAGPLVAPAQTVQFEIAEPGAGEGPTGAFFDAGFLDDGEKNVLGFPSEVTFEVVFEDEDGIDLSSIDGDDIEFVRVAGGPEKTIDTDFLPGDAEEIADDAARVFYRVFDSPIQQSSDNGTYEVRLKEGEVLDQTGAPASAAVIGSFEVAIPFADIWLVDADADRGVAFDLSRISGQVIETDLGTPLTVAAFQRGGAPSGQEIDAVEIIVSDVFGAEVFRGVDDAAPFSLFGDAPGPLFGDFEGALFEEGQYFIEVTPFADGAPLSDLALLTQIDLRDVMGPEAGLLSPLVPGGVETGGFGSSRFFEVELSDVGGVQTATIGDGDFELVRVAGGPEQVFEANFQSVFDIDPIGLFPGRVKASFGLFDTITGPVDNGTYELRYVEGAVLDGDDQPNAASVLETFEIDIPLFSVRAYDAASDAPIAFGLAETPGQTIAADLDAGDLTFAALTFGAETAEGPVSAVRLTLTDDDGVVVASRLERVEPYALFGDRNGDFAGGALAEGDYTLTLTPFVDGEELVSEIEMAEFTLVDVDTLV